MDKRIPTMRLFPKYRNFQKALTLVEVVVTSAILSMMIAGLAAVDSACRGIVRSQRETALGSQVLEEFVEKLRTRNWSQLTNGANVSDLLKTFDCEPLSNLRTPALRVTVTSYPPVTPAPTPLVVERSATGATTIVSQPPAGFSLKSLLAVRVDTRLEWKSAGSERKRSREIVSVVSLSGLLR